MKLTSSKFHKILIVTCSTLTLLNLLNCCFAKYTLVSLSANQFLYINSSLAQVIATFMGFAIGSYAVLNPKIKDLPKKDTTIKDYAEDLSHDLFVSLMYIILPGTITIVFNLIAMGTNDDSFSRFVPFFTIESIILFLFVMIEVIVFARCLRPNAIKEKGSTVKKAIESAYPAESQNPPSTTYSPFLTYYNLLEKILGTFACILTDSSCQTNVIPSSEALDILLCKNIINRETYSIVDEFLLYRNAIVHSLDTDKAVNPIIFSELENIYILLNTAYEAYISKDETAFRTHQDKLLSYTSSHGYSKIDKNIMHYLVAKNAASLQEISKHINYSAACTRSRIGTLQKLGIIMQSGSTKRSLWTLNPEYK